MVLERFQLIWRADGSALAFLHRGKPVYITWCTMFARMVVFTLIAASCGLPAMAADLARIPRVIHKEPAYQSTPKYCLLVFGKDADTHIWMVLDGNTLYVDRNGNSDLTDPGEKLVNNNGSYFTIDHLSERDGTIHKNLVLAAFQKGTFNLQMGVDGQREQFVGIGNMARPSWGDKPGNAPIIHFNGPMTIERYGPNYTVPRGAGESISRRFKLRLLVGTPGLGLGTFASYDDICSEDLGPIQADIEYPNAKNPAEPIVRHVELLHDG
jgi:hypothetical protein